MAGAGFKTFTAGDVLTASDVNTYLMQQSVMVFASSGTRTTAITSPSQGMLTFITGTNTLEYYNGSAWVAVPTSTGAWTSYTPTISPATGAFTTLTYTTQQGAYLQVGKTVHFRVYLLINTFTIGTGAGNITINLPVAALSGATQIVNGKYVNASGSIRSGGTVTGTTISSIMSSDTTVVAATDLAANRAFLFTGTYEAN